VTRDRGAHGAPKARRRGATLLAHATDHPFLRPSGWLQLPPVLSAVQRSRCRECAPERTEGTAEDGTGGGGSTHVVGLIRADAVGFVGELGEVARQE
jgi:hypothetical protein